MATTATNGITTVKKSTIVKNPLVMEMVSKMLNQNANFIEVLVLGTCLSSS